MMNAVGARLVLLLALSLICGAASAAPAPAVSGELRAWHRVTLTFDGPDTSETAEPNPFLDYRLQVTFSRDGREYLVPGFYAADGNAAETGASGGDKWGVHFAPDKAGAWEYEVSFRAGPNVAVSDDPRAGQPVPPLDGLKGTLGILPTDKTGRDNRARGRLEYVGERYLRFAGTGDYFLKQGADAPENFLAYAEFDGPFAGDGHKDNLVKDWKPHVRDWRPGDPTWRDGRGKGIIGAVNYLASEGMNAISFLTLNIGGDDRNVFPYLDYDERTRMDVSRIDQWEIVFDHMDRQGIFLHFKTQETENEMLLDDGDLGIRRRLYYRELIARFGHHLALNWNLGEENGALGRRNQSTAQRHAMAAYFRDHDPYGHPIVIHNGRMPDDLLGEGSALTGFSLQTHRSDFGAVHDQVERWVARSARAGKPWVVACDEPGDAGHALLPDAEDPTHDNARRNALWGTLMAGGAGNEWYFGYQHAHSDLTCNDWRSRDLWWDQCRTALLFFDACDIPLPRMEPRGDLTTTGNWVLAGTRGTGLQCIVAYLRKGGTTTLELPEGSFAFGWLNPRTGDGLRALLSPGRVSGGGSREFAAPGEGDWVLLLDQDGRRPAGP